MKQQIQTFFYPNRNRFRAIAATRTKTSFQSLSWPYTLHFAMLFH